MTQPAGERERESESSVTGSRFCGKLAGLSQKQRCDIWKRRFGASHLAQRLAHALQSWQRAPIRTAEVKEASRARAAEWRDYAVCVCVFVFIEPPGSLLKAVDWATNWVIVVKSKQRFLEAAAVSLLAEWPRRPAVTRKRPGDPLERNLWPLGLHDRAIEDMKYCDLQSKQATAGQEEWWRRCWSTDTMREEKKKTEGWGKNSISEDAGETRMKCDRSGGA